MSLTLEYCSDRLYNYQITFLTFVFLNNLITFLNKSGVTRSIFSSSSSDLLCPGRAASSQRHRVEQLYVLAGL